MSGYTTGRSLVLAFAKSNFPTITIFAAESSTDTTASSFQSSFRPVLSAAISDPAVAGPRANLEATVRRALQAEVDKLFSEFKQYTDEFTNFEAEAAYSWDRAVTLTVRGTDKQGVSQPLEQRGSGFRRILMVAFFRYISRIANTNKGGSIFAVEEPENSLHPGLQRDLVESFRQLARKPGNQIIVTTHSPVFAGASETRDLVLIARSAGVSAISSGAQLSLESIARELGIEPSDQVTTFRACVFVEGPQDADVLRCVSRKLKAAGLVQKSFDEAGIGVVPCGGDNIRHFVTRGLMQRLNRRFGVVIDSDKRSDADSIPRSKLNWKQACESSGGLVFILRKREVENYLHADAIVRGGGKAGAVSDWVDMKEIFGANVSNYFEQMTSDELRARDGYTDESGTHHELEDVVSQLLGLTPT